MKLEYHGLTDVGKVREINEDAFVVLPEADTIVVCDGMGGHAAGEVGQVFPRARETGTNETTERLYLAGNRRGGVRCTIAQANDSFRRDPSLRDGITEL